MNISEHKIYFKNQLSGLYPSEEIQSFFNILTEEYLILSRIEVALNPEKIISEEDVQKFQNVILRLKNHEPIQYIIGETEFYGLVFKVNKYTLIPRPETEELVDWILSENAPATHCLIPTTILDIGTGTGCIAISLAKNLPHSNVLALDISAEALKIATQNAQLNIVEVTFFETDILKAKTLPQQYDVIVSNPPYVRELEKQQMQQNVLNYEPASALYVKDEDPLLFYIAISQLAKTHLKPNGKLFFEINEYLAVQLSELLKNEGFENIEVKKDSYGKDRMLKCNL
ncbi:protein-(glutamine-N5) methyltransferase, release factor-specific [Aequorivita sublithincola DSM 14238]|uniref:Release factor glutamine methyltransferase n=1 Tax=Aequorivita sublithincola (strain DSM 14238 / LMG 21431 / ACAM 643 / 9-3) TaxID=746697 RepID=I3Z099_AEQSU|nr:peptide chain release factor N(5)-glutamine methyltransferase [Aequorivita sublithincola]AFL82667.1 protein-(glutamine-N5) methyltransferase, release factor-specific [Aequorivita sublithincola DSM 14238]